MACGECVIFLFSCQLRMPSLITYPVLVGSFQNFPLRVAYDICDCVSSGQTLDDMLADYRGPSTQFIPVLSFIV